MKIEEIKETLESVGIKTKTLEVAGKIGRSVFYKVSIPKGARAVEAWLDLDGMLDDYWAVITGEWAPDILQERRKLTQALKKADQSRGKKLMEQLKKRYTKDWSWYDDGPVADDGIPECLHDGKWPKNYESPGGFYFAWNSDCKEVQMMLIPSDASLDGLAWFGFGDQPGGHPTATHVAMMRHWHKKYALKLFGINYREFEVMVGNPPTNRKAAMQLAQEQYFYCPDLVHQMEGSVEKLAAKLLKYHAWHFWWDVTSYLQREKH